MDSEKGNRVFARGGTMCPPLVFGAQKKPGLDRVNVDQVRFHGLYRWLCKDFYIEGRLVCLATDNNAILYLYLTFLLTLGQVSVTFRQLPNLPVFCGGRGVWAKYVHARILVNAEIYGRSLNSLCLQTAFVYFFSPWLLPWLFYWQRHSVIRKLLHLFQFIRSMLKN